MNEDLETDPIASGAHPCSVTIFILRVICAISWLGTQVFGQYSHLNVNKQDKTDEFDRKYVSSHQVHTHAK